MTTNIALLCPKRGGRMRNYERSRIPVEQCEECRGIFLDRGELERLIDVEGGGWSGRVEAPTHVAADDRRDRRDDGGEDGDDTGRRSSNARQRERIGRLMDLFGD